MGGGNLGLEADGQEDTGDEREDVCAGTNSQKSTLHGGYVYIILGH